MMGDIKLVAWRLGGGCVLLKVVVGEELTKKGSRRTEKDRKVVGVENWTLTFVGSASRKGIGVRRV